MANEYSFWGHARREGEGGGKGEEGERGEREKARERRWTAQFISVGLISVASRGLRLTFRWSFVRSSFHGRRRGEVRRRRTDKGRPAFLRQHTGRPYRVPVEEDEVAAEEHSVQRKGKEEEEEKEDGGTRTHRPIKLQCPSKVHRRRQGSLDLPY